MGDIKSKHGNRNMADWMLDPPDDDEYDGPTPGLMPGEGEESDDAYYDIDECSANNWQNARNF
jgi:hypothetical protein